MIEVDAATGRRLEGGRADDAAGDARAEAEVPESARSFLEALAALRRARALHPAGTNRREPRLY